MSVRGVRGATTVENDSPEEIHEATRELLQSILAQNTIESFEEIGSIIFTTTPDLTSTFPAEAARGIGMSQVPLLCASEIAVEGKCPAASESCSTGTPKNHRPKSSTSTCGKRRSCDPTSLQPSSPYLSFRATDPNRLSGITTLPEMLDAPFDFDFSTLHLCHRLHSV